MIDDTHQLTAKITGTFSPINHDRTSHRLLAGPNSMSLQLWHLHAQKDVLDGLDIVKADVPGGVQLLERANCLTWSGLINLAYYPIPDAIDTFSRSSCCGRFS